MSHSRRSNSLPHPAAQPPGAGAKPSCRAWHTSRPWESTTVASESNHDSCTDLDSTTTRNHPGAGRVRSSAVSWTVGAQPMRPRFITTGGFTSDASSVKYGSTSPCRGRTHNLIRNAQSTARAQLESERATERDITLAVWQAFYQALTAQSVLKVAQQTVATQQATGEQIGALANQKLRSTLDLSLAQVQVSQAQLLVLNAQNAEQAAMAALNAILGSESDQNYELVDDTSSDPPPPPTDAEGSVGLALHSRPDLASLEDRTLAARQFASAEHDLNRPTISALAAGGGAPVRSDQILSPWYGAAGANISIPVFNGFAFSARAKQADLRAQAASEQTRGLRDTIARDVRTAVLNAQAAYQRIAVTQEMLNQTNLALDLAQARYKIGLSSIVELTDAQLAQTQAEIANTSARYAYQTALAEVKYQAGQ